MGRALSIFSLATIAMGYLLFYYDDNYGPKDQIIYLRPVPVMILMGVAFVVLIFQFFAFLSRL